MTITLKQTRRGCYETEVNGVVVQVYRGVASYERSPAFGRTARTAPCSCWNILKRKADGTWHKVEGFTTRAAALEWAAKYVKEQS